MKRQSAKRGSATLAGVLLTALALFFILPSVGAFDVPGSLAANNSITASAGETVTIDARNSTRCRIVFQLESAVSNGWVNITFSGRNATNTTGVFNEVNITASADVESALSWARIELYYTDGDLSAPYNLTESSLSMVTRNATGESWTAASSTLSMTDTGVWSGYVATNQTHFSHWAIEGDVVPAGATVYSFYTGWNLMSLYETPD